MNVTDLVGKKIKGINYNGGTITFITNEGSLQFKAVGDCCSTSYIEDIDNPEIFNDSEMLSVDIESGEQEVLSDFDVHRWTFYKFKTTKGNCTLSFRNESNGYYNGWLEFNG